MTLRIRAVALAGFTVVQTAVALAAPQIPNSALPGREREQILGKPYTTGPQIELRGGKPAPVFEVEERKRKAKRRKCRGGKRC